MGSSGQESNSMEDAGVRVEPWRYGGHGRRHGVCESEDWQVRKGSGWGGTGGAFSPTWWAGGLLSHPNSPLLATRGRLSPPSPPGLQGTSVSLQSPWPPEALFLPSHQSPFFSLSSPVLQLRARRKGRGRVWGRRATYLVWWQARWPQLATAV